MSITRGKVVGLQFHLETSEESAKALIENSAGELMEKGKYIQSSEEMLSDREKFLQIEKLLFKLLDNIEKI
ncbi:MAG: hypothetical protein Q9M89_03650 [Persephonella sp.]|nr:hypothetical protein [Persephonella sp.]